MAAPAERDAMTMPDGLGFEKEKRAIVSGTQARSAATDAEPDAETVEADEVSDYSEDADGFDAPGPSDDVAAPAEGGADDPPADGTRRRRHEADS